MSETARQGWKRALRYLPVALFIGAALFSCWTAYYFAGNITDADVSSEMVLGKFLADQNKIFSTDWFYSTEIRMFNANLVYMPLFKIFDSWLLVRFFSSILLQAMIVGSYYYFSRRIQMRKNAFFLSAALMLLPISIHYGRYILYQYYYAPTFIYSFLIAGLFLSFVRRQGQNRLGQALRLAGMAALAFLSCLNGMRQFPATMLPLFLTVLIVTVKSRRGSPLNLREIPKVNWIALGAAGMLCIVGLAGLYVHNSVLSRYFSVLLRDDSIVSFSSADGLLTLLRSYLRLFGFVEGEALFSLDGVFSIGGAIAAAVLLIVSLGDLVPRKRAADPAAALMQTMYPVAILVLTLILLLTQMDENGYQYYFPSLAWLFPYLAVTLDQGGGGFSLKKQTLRQSAVWLTCLFLFFNGIHVNLFFLNPEEKQVGYISSGIREMDTLDRMDGVLKYLEENECEVGYSTFWYANLITELTDGRIPMIPIYRVYPDPAYLYEDWLTAKQFREESFVEDKNVFLLLSIDETYVFGDSELAAYAIPTYQDEYFQIYAFDFSTGVWEYLLEQAEYYHQTSVLEQLSPEK